MRVGTQLAIAAALLAAGYGGFTYWKSATVPPATGPAGAAPKAAGPQRGPGRVLVEVTQVGTGTISESSEAVGTTRAYESVALTAKVTGIVEKILFDEGQTVKVGDLLLSFDSAERLADLEAARAAISTTRAQRQETLLKLERAQALRRSGAGTEAQVADLTLQVKTIETNIAAAEARERAASARLEDLQLRAPFSGRVGLRQVSPGAFVDNKIVVTTLDDVSRIRLDFSVPEALVSRVATNSPIRAQTIAFQGRWFEGRVAVIDTRIDTVTRSAKVTAIIDNADGALKPGMFMGVSLKVATRENAVLVPEEAIVAEGPRQIAFLVKDGKVERRVVRIGQREAGMVEVSDGLAVGETLIVRGVQKVRPGAQVDTKPAFPEAGGKPAAKASGSAGKG